VHVAVKPIEDVCPQFQTLFDEVTAAFVVPEQFNDGEELLRVALVDLGVQLVVDEAVGRDPAALYHRLADDGGDAGEGIRDDAHAGDADLQFVQHAGGGED